MGCSPLPPTTTPMMINCPTRWAVAARFIRIIIHHSSPASFCSLMTTKDWKYKLGSSSFYSGSCSAASQMSAGVVKSGCSFSSFLVYLPFKLRLSRLSVLCFADKQHEINPGSSPRGVALKWLMKSSVIREEAAALSELQVQGVHCIHYEVVGVISYNISFDIVWLFPPNFSTWIKPQSGIKNPVVLIKIGSYMVA